MKDADENTPDLDFNPLPLLTVLPGIHYRAHDQSDDTKDAQELHKLEKHLAEYFQKQYIDSVPTFERAECFQWSQRGHRRKFQFLRAMSSTISSGIRTLHSTGNSLVLGGKRWCCFNCLVRSAQVRGSLHPRAFNSFHRCLTLYICVSHLVRFCVGHRALSRRLPESDNTSIRNFTVLSLWPEFWILPHGAFVLVSWVNETAPLGIVTTIHPK